VVRSTVLTAALIACAAVAPTRAHAQAAAAPDTTITLRSAGSALEFLPDKISIKAGKRVRIRYTNEGTLPHNLVFVKDAEDLDAIASAAYQAGATNFVPLAMKDKLIAYTELVSSGKTVEVTFVVPAPGEYPFICLFPGHSGMMIGTLRALR